MNKAKLLIALLAASASGFLSVLMIQSPERIGATALFLFPGAVLAIIASGNVHYFRT